MSEQLQNLPSTAAKRGLINLLLDAATLQRFEEFRIANPEAEAEVVVVYGEERKTFATIEDFVRLLGFEITE